jgi:hypothetical protein
VLPQNRHTRVHTRRHPSGDGISARYFKQSMLTSEVNGRFSEPRSRATKSNRGATCRMHMASPITDSALSTLEWIGKKRVNLSIREG